MLSLISFDSRLETAAITCLGQNPLFYFTHTVTGKHPLKLLHQLTVGNRKITIIISKKTIHHHGRQNFIPGIPFIQNKNKAVLRIHPAACLSRYELHYVGLNAFYNTQFRIFSNWIIRNIHAIISGLTLTFILATAPPFFFQSAKPSPTCGTYPNSAGCTITPLKTGNSVPPTKRNSIPSNLTAAKSTMRSSQKAWAANCAGTTLSSSSRTKKPISTVRK